MHNNRHLSLTGRLYVALTLAAAAVFLAFFAVIWWTESNSLETMLQQNGRSLSAGLEQGIQLGVQLGETDFVRDGAASVVAIPDVLAVDIYDASGQRMIQIKGSHEPLTVSQLTASFQSGLLYETINGGKQERVIAAMHTKSGEVIGYSVLTLSRAVVNGALSSALMTSAVISIVLLLLFWWMAWLAIRQLGRPLNELVYAVDAVADGRLDVTINADIPEPLARIAIGFNRMTDSLAGNRHAIEAHTMALAMSERRFRELFVHIPVAMYMADIDGTIRQCNPAMARMFGYETEPEMLEHIRRTTELFRTHGDRDLLVAELLREESIVSRDVQMMSHDRGVLQCLLHARLVTDSEGHPLGVEGVIQDLTEFKVLEHNLMQAQKMEAVGQLAGGIAHDFNNLLAIILGNADLLVRHVISDDVRSQHYAERIMQAAKRASELTGNLLGFARKGTMRRETVEICSLLDEVAGLIRETCDRRVHVSVECHQGLRVTGDPGQLHQVLMNLAINGLHAMPDGGRLSLMGRLKGGRAVIRVVDSGVGMTDTVMKRIFEPFFTTRETGKGTGLGLAMVYGIVEKLGGQIAVDSAPGKGTSFEISLPLYEEPEKAAEQSEPLHPELPAISGCVLLVDDEELLREVGAGVLESSGLEVHTVASGEEALEVLAAGVVRPDLVLLDMNMPGIGGLETLRAIRNRYDAMKVVILTGYSETTLDADEGELRYDGFVSKPYHAGDLCAEVSRVLLR
ncbi:response regulator [Mariprofundus erugo]|uniref:histidine kinase n=1 Tax=Mariprofundus erugo TaxID=2528639 RepID=A0A5R9GTY7_9PROT|nr:ATP-binding protein [Mariprofundus erugo]TLS67893.1 response regulator [Mariprofundus erugo]